MVGPAKVYRLQCSIHMKMSNFNGIGYAFEPVRDRPAVSDYHHMEDDQSMVSGSTYSTGSCGGK